MEFAEFIKSPRVDKVVLQRRGHAEVEGTLCVTGHHLIFSSRTQENEELMLMHSGIEFVEKKFTGQAGNLKIFGKNFSTVKLKFASMEDAMNVAESIDTLSVIGTPSFLYPFFYHHLDPVNEDGWNLYDIETDFKKLLLSCPNWRVSCANEKYQLCPSYPEKVIVPRNISDELIAKSAEFRHHGRFPVLSYFHLAKGVPLMRSSQPLCGLGGKRCKEDEKLVNSCLGLVKKGFIIDTRSQTNAMNSRSKGGGVEIESHYPQWKRFFRNFENYHSLNDSLAKLVEGCLDQSATVSTWLTKLEASAWLGHIQVLISSSVFAAHCLDKEGASVLVHGNNGWDSSLQVTSLVQILLNPECRTVRGFERLIEQEWLAAGHPFQERCIKLGVSSSRYKGQAPVFLLFLDCVWQIYNQYPCSFEFNEKFLITIFQHAYSSQFGTFLCNNERERLQNDVPSRTVSLWSHLNRENVLHTFLNPSYEPNRNNLSPSVAPQSLMVWSGLYRLWIVKELNQEQVWKEVQETKLKNSSLKNRAEKLREEYAELQRRVKEKLNEQQ